jgi:hypothetical protein
MLYIVIRGIRNSVTNEEYSVSPLFFECICLTTLTLRDSVVAIANSTFENLASLPSLVQIGQ